MTWGRQKLTVAEDIMTELVDIKAVRGLITGFPGVVEPAWEALRTKSEKWQPQSDHIPNFFGKICMTLIKG